MKREFDRNVEWTDWKGNRYTLRDEWRYVNGPAVPLEGCTPGVRDADNGGKTPLQFLEDTSAFIKSRRSEGNGLLIPEDCALLSLEEVLSIRLYSGPAYQVINEFMRQAFSMSGALRAELAMHAGHTFTATVRHLCCGIRKLAAVSTPEEAVQPLFRGVRGELKNAFWTPDAQGMVCAVDIAFMSTSRNSHTPIEYMADGMNVLWELEPQLETDAAFHRGADISFVSCVLSLPLLVFATLPASASNPALAQPRVPILSLITHLPCSQAIRGRRRSSISPMHDAFGQEKAAGTGRGRGQPAQCW